MGARKYAGLSGDSAYESAGLAAPLLYFVQTVAGCCNYVWFMAAYLPPVFLRITNYNSVKLIFLDILAQQLSHGIYWIVQIGPGVLLIS